ncbi:unnamed protein product [Rhizopus stolonifer]
MTKVSTYMGNLSQIVFLTMILLKDRGLIFGRTVTCTPGAQEKKKHSSDISNVQDSVQDLDQDDVDDNVPKSNDSDVSRKRLLSLKAIIKDILLSKEGGNTAELVKDCCSDISKDVIFVLIYVETGRVNS